MKKTKYPNKLINQINNKKFKDLNSENQKIIKSIVHDVKKESVIQIYKLYTCKKCILKLVIEEKSFLIYVLQKENEIIYDSLINDFCSYLKTIKLDIEIIYEILLFHWGDETYNNTGKKRYSFDEFRKLHSKTIININKELNKNIYFITFINKLLFTDLKLNNSISYLLIKSKNKWLIYDKKTTIDILSSIKYKNDQRIHIGPFILQNKKRNLTFNKQTESKRKHLIIKWINYSSILNKN